VLPANGLALAWLVVAAVEPADVFDAGCQLSFLAVAILIGGTRSWGKLRLLRSGIRAAPPMRP
jgi:predicted membrane metal-binding protein